VLEAVRASGRLDRAVYGEQLGSEHESYLPAAARDGRGPYLSTVIVPAARNGSRGEKL
jgi:precorrin-2/cobalt-factor-2 C20-methyltransferase